MKRSSKNWIAAVLLVLASPVAYSLDAEDEQLRRAVSLMQNEQWQLAYAVFSEVDEAEQAAGVSKGDYGKLLFSMGLCQMELAKAEGAEQRDGFYQKALEDFRRCRGFIGAPDDQNPYIRRSLLRLGMCYQALEQFDAAYAAYSAFLVERNQITDMYDHGSLLLNLATCCLRQTPPADAKALSYLQQAMDGRERHKIAIESLCDGALDVYAIAAGRLSEDQEKSVLKWLTELTPNPAGDSDVMLTRLCNTAQILSDTGNMKSAQSLLNVLPWLSELPAKTIDLSGSVGRDPVLVARSIEQFSYTQAAQLRSELLSQLIQKFPQSDRIQEWLYQCILAHFELDEMEWAQIKVELYKLKFPSGKYREAIGLLELSGLFDAGQYAEALALAEGTVAGSEEQKEALLYVMAGSTCFLGEYQRSLDLTAKYSDEYPAGEHSTSVEYFRGVSYARLGFAALARPILEKIAGVTTVEGEQYYAQYELAMLDFEYASFIDAQKRLAEMLELELFPSLRVQVHLLSARTSAILRDREAAEASYLETLELSRSAQLPELEQEVLFYLIAFYGREKVADELNPDIEKCLPYYEEFFEKFADSAYAAQVASVAMPALKSAGELDRGIQTLERVLQSACSLNEEAGVRNAANALVWAKIDAGMKPSELKAQLMSQQSSRFLLVQWFALTEVYHAGLDQAHLSWGRKFRYDAQLRAMYADLSMRAKDVKLPSYIDSALGGWYLIDGNFPQLAQSHFSRAQSSSLIRQRELADLGLAKSLRISASDVDLQQASVVLQGLLDRSTEDMHLLGENHV